MMEPVGDFFIPTFPVVLFIRLIEDIDLRAIFSNLFFSPASQKEYGLNWEDSVQDYLYLNLSLLSGDETCLKQLFPFATMSINTAEIEFMVPNVEKCVTDMQIQHRTPNIITCKGNAEYNVKELKECLVLKNGVSSQAGDILVIGLGDNILHIQCKWPDSEKTLSYAIIKNEMKKNSQLVFNGCMKKNITVIITGRMVTDLPSEEEFEDDLVVISKNNFSGFFGLFADHMKLHTNSISTNWIQNS